MRLGVAMVMVCVPLLCAAPASAQQGGGGQKDTYLKQCIAENPPNRSQLDQGNRREIIARCVQAKKAAAHRVR